MSKMIDNGLGNGDIVYVVKTGVAMLVAAGLPCFLV